MNLTKNQLLTAQQALGYAVLHAKTEEETAEFALLKIDIDSAVIRMNANEVRQMEHDKKDCPFKFCDSIPACEGFCKYSVKIHLQ